MSLSRQLPTRTALFANSRDALDRAYSELSEARDWLHSDWAPVGSELTAEAAAARTSVLRAIAEAKGRIVAAKADITAAIDSLAEPQRQPGMGCTSGPL